MQRKRSLIAGCLVLILAAVPQWARADLDNRPAWTAHLVQVLPADKLYMIEIEVRNTGRGAAEHVQVLAGGLALTRWVPVGSEVAVWPAGVEQRFRLGPLDPRAAGLDRRLAWIAAWSTHIKVRWQEAGRTQEQVLR